jgi:hypothetical protein
MGPGEGLYNSLRSMAESEDMKTLDGGSHAYSTRTD